LRLTPPLAMVGVTKIQRGNAGYWLAAVQQGKEDYYTKPGEAPGEWIGALAAELELSGQVDAEGYGAILEGTDPTSGDQLVKRPDTRFRDRPTLPPTARKRASSATAIAGEGRRTLIFIAPPYLPA
jgi:TrwC relaxase